MFAQRGRRAELSDPSCKPFCDRPKGLQQAGYAGAMRYLASEPHEGDQLGSGGELSRERPSRDPHLRRWNCRAEGGASPGAAKTAIVDYQLIASHPVELPENLPTYSLRD